MKALAGCPDLVGIADFRPDNAIASLKRVGWNPEAYAAKSFEEALKNRTFHRRPEIDVIVECTGNPVSAVEHCLAAFREGGKPMPSAVPCRGKSLPTLNSAGRAY
jgi:threonine dehydrogenase-like Zn-dependent dehydrogenase